jgi:hypothetical protein
LQIVLRQRLLALRHFGFAILSLLFNDGQGAFSAAADVAAMPVGKAPFAVVAAHLNDDNRDGLLDDDDLLDLAVACFGSHPDPSDPGSVWILRNNGDGSFAPGVRYRAGNAPASIAAADLNGDGYTDLAVANFLSDDISIYVNDGNGAFTVQTYRAGMGPMDIASADIDGDGDWDLVVTSSTHQVLVIRNDGTGRLAQPEILTPAPLLANIPTSRPISVVAADLHGDGRIDLAVSNGHTDKVWVLQNKLGPKEDQAASNRVAIDIAFQDSVARADVNRDGVVSAADALELVNYLNQHGATPWPPSTSPHEQSARDVNRDGLVTPADLLVVINSVNAQQVGEGEPGAVPAYPSVQTGSAGDMADVDGDPWASHSRSSGISHSDRSRSISARIIPRASRRSMPCMSRVS